MKFKKEIHPAFDDLGNVYEEAVFAAIAEQLGTGTQAPGFLADVACVALNKLPAKYIRHHVDMSFYMTKEESSEMDSRVKTAVAEAIDLVRSHQRD